MAQITVSRNAARQIEVIRAYYDEKDALVAERAKAALLGGIEKVSKYPAIGRPAIGRPGLRELVVPFGRTGFLALYRDESEHVVILAVRHQRQAGYDFEKN